MNRYKAKDFAVEKLMFFLQSQKLINNLLTFFQPLMMNLLFNSL